MELVPDTCFLPVPQATPAGDAAAAAHFLGQHFPRNAAFEHEQNPGHGGPVRHPRSSAFGLGRFHRQQRCNHLPQFIGEKLLDHGSSITEPVWNSLGFERRS